MIRPVLSLATIATLTACVSSAPLTPVQKMQIVQNKDHQYGTTTTYIRSYTKDENGKRVEVGGMKCSGKNAWLVMPTVTTPAQVETPMYLQAERFQNGGKPPVLNVICRLNDKTVKLAIHASSDRGNTVVSNGTQYNPSTGTYSTPTTTVLTSRISSTLPWGYPSFQVEF